MDEYKQIYEMLKKYNKLNDPQIDNANVRIVIRGDDNSIIGYGELIKMNFAISEIRHVFVHENFRNRKLAQKINELLMHECDTPIIIATVRKENNVMRHIMEKMGFINAAQFTSPISKKEIVLYMKVKK